MRLAMMAEELTEKVQRSTEKQRKKLQTQPLLQRPTIMARSYTVIIVAVAAIVVVVAPAASPPAATATTASSTTTCTSNGIVSILPRCSVVRGVFAAPTSTWIRIRIGIGTRFRIARSIPIPLLPGPGPSLALPI